RHTRCLSDWSSDVCSSDLPASMTSYAWSIVNGTITSATNTQSVTYTAGTSGTVDLTLTVTNSSSCTATSTSHITINATPPAPTISANPMCASSTGNTASTTATGTYAWTISNGTIVGASNGSSITYTAGASRTVDLTITPTPAQVCASSTGNSASGPASMTSYAWSIANGTITSATNTQSVTYTAGTSGTVDLTLTVTNSSSCTATSTSHITINANPAA